MDKKDKRIRVLEHINEETRSINADLKKEKTCLHCNSGISAYCESCYQELISTNAKLQLDNTRIIHRLSNYIRTNKEEVEKKIRARGKGQNGIVTNRYKLFGRVEAYNEMLNFLDD